MKLIRPLPITDAVLTASNVLEADYPVWSAGNTYATGDYVMVVAANTHQVWVSAAAGNIGHAPASSPTWWTLVGATNRWRMFDTSNTSQTSNANTIVVTLATVGRVDSVALLGVEAKSIRVRMIDATAGVVYDQTRSMISASGITNMWQYWFEPVTYLADLVLTDLPPYSGATIEITIDNTGATAKCGTCVVGQGRRLGDTQRGCRVGIDDYSVKTRDQWGNYYVREGAYNRRGEFTIQIDRGAVDWLAALLAGYRATPIVYVGTGDYASTVIFGFYETFQTDIAGALKSILTISIRGLT